MAFVHGEHRLALMASAVVEVARVVAAEPLQGAPVIVEGAINVRGTLVPVLDVRARFGFPAAEISVDQHLMIAQVGSRRVALPVDRALELVRVDEGAIEPSEGRVARRDSPGVSSAPSAAPQRPKLAPGARTPSPRSSSPFADCSRWRWAALRPYMT